MILAMMFQGCKQVAIGNTQIIIRENPYEGLEKYYGRLLGRYGEHPITNVNLLRYSPGANETALSEVCARLLVNSQHN